LPQVFFRSGEARSRL